MRKKIKILLIIAASCFFLGIMSIFGVIAYYSKGLPNYEQLKKYNPPLTTRVYAKDGRLIKEFAKEKRLFVSIENIPAHVKQAFLAAEDANFYNHPGVDMKALTKAMISNVSSYLRGKRMRGASTITQQVVKNFLLTDERTIDRKAKEAILALRISKALTKDQVLELYLNQIYLGASSYGVASAAVNYFDKSLMELTIEEAAMLAALPKSPSAYNPWNNYDNAKVRRDWVIRRMREERFITRDDEKTAKETPINLQKRPQEETVQAGSFTDAVRRELTGLFGEKEMLTEGYVVRTTLEPELQQYATKYLRWGIEEYERRHGYRGSLDNIYTESKDEEGNKIFDWQVALREFNNIPEYNSDWRLAVVTEINDKKKYTKIGVSLKKKDLETIILSEVKTELEKNPDIDIDSIIEEKIQETDNMQEGMIPFKNLKWARKFIDVDTQGAWPKKPSDVDLKVGDIILVNPQNLITGIYELKQIPQINGALLAMDPHTGRILAMSGGYYDKETSFNRATQAMRQPGSVLKTFAYLAALENGYTPASIVMDEEIVLDQGYGMPPYRPKNYSSKFYGPTPLRMGLEKSRNVATVRLASEVGLGKITDYIKKFGVNDNPKKIYSIVLGSTETNLIKLTKAYAMIINGGKSIEPSVIERIQDKHGSTVYKRDRRECSDCLVSGNELNKKFYETKKENVSDEEIIDAVLNGTKTPIQQKANPTITNFEEIAHNNMKKLIFPQILDERESIISPQSAYQLTSLLEGVVKRGTGWKAKAIGKPIGGKTGTTNAANDAWFVGFTPDLVVSVYIGYDNPKTLGNHESGSSVALPVFVKFMKDALQDKPSTPFRVPDGIKFVKIDRTTGYYPTPVTASRDIIYEAFKEGDKIKKRTEEIEEEAEDILSDEDSEYLEMLN